MRLAQRAPTPLEADLLSIVAGDADRKTGGPFTHTERSLWVDGMLADALFQVALAAAVAGARVLFVSPLNDQLAFRQLKFGRRVPLLSLKARAKEKIPCGGYIAWSTPEDLEAIFISRAFGVTGPELIFVEEAQCASPLLNAYRPSFKNLERVLNRYPHARVISGASISLPAVRHEVAQLLARPELAVERNFRKEAALLDSPHLTLKVNTAILGGDETSPAYLSAQTLSQDLLQLITDMPRPSVILCATVAEADAVYGALATEQLPVHRFHAGLSQAERASELLQFSLPGRRALMVAVSGFFSNSGLFGEAQGDVPENFGPGYTRRDIRSLVHLSAPASVEQYAMELRLLAAGPSTHQVHTSTALDESTCQEDPGEADSISDDSANAKDADANDEVKVLFRETPPAALTALLVYHPAQLAFTIELLEKKRPSPEGLLALARALADCGTGWVKEQTLTRHGVESRKQLRVYARFMADAGQIETRSVGGHSELRVKSSAAELLQHAKEIAHNLERLQNGHFERLTQVALYAEGSTCRQLTLNMLLGRIDEQDPRLGSGCGRCDQCAKESPDAAVRSIALLSDHAENSAPARKLRRTGAARP